MGVPALRAAELMEQECVPLACLTNTLYNWGSYCPGRADRLFRCDALDKCIAPFAEVSDLIHSPAGQTNPESVNLFLNHPESQIVIAEGPGRI